MQAHRLLILSVLLSVVGLCKSSEPQLCQLSTVTEAMLSLTSRRNLTGHWESMLSLQHNGSADGVLEDKATGPYEVDLQHKTSTCDGKQVVKIEATIIVPPKRAGPGYELVQGLGLYKFHTDINTWDEARKVCAQEGAHLAIINSENESKALQQMQARYPKLNEWAFVGFHDVFTEGTYITIFGDPLSTTGFIRWSTGQPNNSGREPGEDCGTIHRNGGGLGDNACTTKIPFICEQELW